MATNELEDITGSLESPTKAATSTETTRTGMLGNGAIANAIQRIKTLFASQQSQVAPWKEFFARPALPENAADATKRIMHNTGKFRANYVIVAMGLAAYTLFTSPLIIVALALIYLGFSLITQAKENGGTLAVFGKEMSSRDLTLATAIGGGLMLWISSATTTIFWLLGMTIAVVAGHGALTSIPRAESLSQQA